MFSDGLCPRGGWRGGVGDGALQICQEGLLRQAARAQALRILPFGREQVDAEAICSSYRPSPITGHLLSVDPPRGPGCRTHRGGGVQGVDGGSEGATHKPSGASAAAPPSGHASASFPSRLPCTRHAGLRAVPHIPALPDLRTFAHPLPPAHVPIKIN